jgi:hypothetical protein
MRCTRAPRNMQGHSAVFYKMKPRGVAVLQGLAIMFLMVCVGAIMLHTTEHTGWLDSYYWALTTLATVGELCTCSSAEQERCLLLV